MTGLWTAAVMTVEWERLADAAPLPEDMIRGAELLLGVRFPADYRECLRVNHGAYPSPDEFEVPIEGRPFRSGFGVLLTVDPRDRYYSLFDRLAPLAYEHGLPPEVVPVAVNGGGDFICLDYRADPTRSAPSVAYWHHEVSGTDGLAPVAGSFGELLDGLQPGADD